MKMKGLLVVALALMIAASISAAELKGTTVVTAKVPVFMPVFTGQNFQGVNGGHQPFMAGWDFGLSVRRGFTDRIMAGFTAGYLSTYDDTTNYDNAGDDFTNTDAASAKLTGLALGFEGYWFYQPEWKLQPYLLAGVGVDIWSIKDRATDDSHGVTDLNVKIGTGMLFPINDKWSVDVQVKLTDEAVNLSQDVPAGFYGAQTWEQYRDRPFRGYLEPSVGICYFFGGEPDTDHDGVPDSRDNCPDTPRGVKVDKAGCPLDTDADGVPDYLDKCPGTPASVKVDANGCPLDSDGDGVADYLDKCANTPKGLTVNADGCPPDADGDGVPDQLDKCPDTPKGAPVDAVGCPLDSDGDGVFDYLDKCARTPKGVPVDKDGCPLVKKITEKITLNIKYATNSYEPDAASKLRLDSIAERIFAYPETIIEIRGFTDDRGPTDKNQTLSENRAKGVMEYLKSKGVPAEQMETKGYGEDPKYFVGDNNTEAGRAANRRVELESKK